MGRSHGATQEGTKRYTARMAALTAPEHFRLRYGLSVSTIGLGTYLGQCDQRTDLLYQEAVARAIELGCNVIDSAINYRAQRSERSIGVALKKTFDADRASRDEIIVATKAGFFSFDGEMPRSQREAQQWAVQNFVDTGVVQPGDIVGSHCMAPKYLDNQLTRSLENLGLQTIDVFYLHNPESQLDGVSRDEFRRRLTAAFEFLEAAAGEGRIQFYGTATWNGYRQSPQARDYLSLPEIERIAREVGGEDHRFRVVQLPYNLAMPEALTVANQLLNGEQVSPLVAADRLGITVMCSASIFQSRLTHGLPPFVGEALKGLTTDAQRAIQFVRSTPGVTTALVGMSQRSHVEENLLTAKVPPASTDDFMSMFAEAG